jgi:hypothetical protein
MNRRPVTETVEDFKWTFADHNGDVRVAADRLGMKPDTLARALYRAKQRGQDVVFYDTTQRRGRQCKRARS